ncbi:hypothetical protein ACFL5F_04050 [Planctomycetota bacterium]
MNTENRQERMYAVLKALKGGKPVSVDMADITTIEGLRSRYQNRDLLVSTWHSAVPDISAPRNYSLYFHIISGDVEKARVSTLEACLYISENFGVPEDCIEVLYTGGVDRGDTDDDNINHAGGPLGHTTAAGDNETQGQHTTDTHNKSKNTGASEWSTSAAEMLILIAPVVFGGQPTALMQLINYHLARQMADDGLSNIDIHVYVRDSYIPLPNSNNSATGRFVIPLTMKELLYLDGNRIAELSRQPRPEDSMIMPQQASEVTEWFAEVHAEFEKKQNRQNELRKAMLEEGWEISPCIRRLLRLCLYDHVRLEAYRTISRFLSWIGASESEIRYQIHSIDRRNPIKNYQKLNGITTFAVESPWFVGCQHALLRQFCPAGGCFITELIEKYEKPYLFEQV